MTILQLSLRGFELSPLRLQIQAFTTKLTCHGLDKLKARAINHCWRKII